MAKPEAGMMVTTSVKLVRPLGEGGMGSVWLADHQALHTKVVVKFIASEYAGNAEALARFSREAAAASQVKSPHVVQTLDHGVTTDGLPYIVMELLEGHDLETHLADVGSMQPKQVADVVTQLARALEKAHSIGIVHRDIKPANIFLCDAGDGALFVKLLDFGIAKGANMGLLDSGTRTGAMIGSPYYMSPEQLIGAKDIDAKTDLWSVGVVAYEALTGQRAFEAETVGALALKIHNEPIPLPSQVNPELANLDDWFAKACGKKPQDRFSSAKEMADALAAAIAGDLRRGFTSAAPPPTSRRPQTDSLRRVENAKTQVDPTTDPRGRTDAGLGLQSNTSAPTSSGRGKGFTVAVGLIAVALIGVAAFGVAKLTNKQGQAGPDPSAGMVSNSVQNTSTTQTATSAVTAATGATPSAATSNSASPTGSTAPVASTPKPKNLQGAGGAAGVPSQKPVHNPQGQASSTRKPGDDIY